MDIILSRRNFREDGIFGEMTDEKGKFICVTLERAFKIDEQKTADDGTEFISTTYQPIVPKGVYKCIRYDSPKHGYQVFLLVDVPGHDHVEIHIGNWNHDSDGCILLGRQYGSRLVPGGMMIVQSSDAFKSFMASQSGIDAFMLTVE